MPQQQQQQQRESSWLIDMRTTFNLVTFVVDTHTACIRPFTRSHMGTRGMGAAGFWAMLAIPLYAGLAEASDLLSYWYLWLGMVICRRIKADKYQHPHYQGWPWMFDWCMKSDLGSRLMEAATMPLLGSIVSAFSEDVGLFVTAGVFSFGLRYAIDAMTSARRREAARIARIEMELMQRYYE
jgi:hypothetical protein